MITNNDLTTRAIEWALDGLEKRSQVTANNIANSEVPNFHADRVDFESQLSNAIRGGRITRVVDPLVSTSADAPGLNGNNVQMEDELVTMIKTNLTKNAMIEAFNYKAGMLRAAMRGQA